MGSTNDVLGSRKFKTVFIDEAAQAMAPTSFIPILRAERVIFAGDHLQLPPTVKSRDAQRQGLGESLMEKCFTRQLGLGIENIGKMLQTQYRMNTEIMGFSSKVFYDDGLIADASVARHRLLAPSHDSFEAPENTPLEFLDTAGCGFAEEQNPDTLSRYNDQEAGMLMTHLDQLLQFLATQNTAPLSIGLIAPYRAQIDTLQEKFAISGYAERYPHQFEINTIDGFQGQERDIIYISLTRSNDNSEIGFLSDRRRMNVALTRARKKLVLVGDSATVCSDSFFADMVDHFAAHGMHNSAFTLLGAHYALVQIPLPLYHVSARRAISVSMARDCAGHLADYQWRRPRL